LRQDILDAASEILETTGSEDAVTLRAIAREVGIAAPSIYGHFPDREAVLDQLVADAFRQLTASLDEARRGVGDPSERLLAGCRAYLAFAVGHPRRYWVLFDHSAPGARRRDAGSVPVTEGLAAFNVLVRGIADCAQAGQSASVDHFADAVAVWTGLHGLATLSASLPSFPWPDRDQLVRALVGRLARLNAA
jgi:AcrR family transcriptional regulator